MISLPQIIQHQFPLADLGIGGDVSVVSDGDGERIARWNEDRLGPQPTPDFLESKRAEVEAALAERQRYLDLREALSAVMDKLRNPMKIARIYPLKPAIASAFDSQMPLVIIRMIIENCNVSDDAELTARKNEMLDLLK